MSQWMPQSMRLAEFGAAVAPLTARQRAAIIHRALCLFGHTEQAYRLHQAYQLPSDREFHHELGQIYRTLDDPHTVYLLPEPYASRFAYLPFRVERTGCGRYLVTKVVPGFTAPGFEPGVRVTHWNGVPITWAVAILGARSSGRTPAARLARALDALTLRPLLTWVPPDEDPVTVTYRGSDGAVYSLWEPWRVGEIPAPASASEQIDHDADARVRARKLLFRPDVVAVEGGRTAAFLDRPVAVTAGDLATHLPGVLRARVTGSVGHVRIYTLRVADPAALRTEIHRLARLLPSRLVLDLRGVDGGIDFDIPAVRIVDAQSTVDGLPVDDLLTRRDLLGDNEDLLDHVITGTSATANSA